LWKSARLTCPGSNNAHH